MLSSARTLLLLFAAALFFQTEAQKDADLVPLELSPGLAAIFKLDTTTSDVDSVLQLGEKIKCKEDDGGKGFTFTTAPSLGHLTSSAVKEMDRAVKVMILGTLKLANQTELTNWKTVVSLFEDSPFTQQRTAPIHREGEKVFSGEVYLSGGQRRKGSIRNEVQEWFQEFIRDEDILNTTRIDIEDCSKVVGATGSRIKSIGTLFNRKIRKKERKAVEVGVIRFPQLDDPYWKVYRIEIYVWKSAKRDFIRHKFRNGIRGVFTQLEYEPRELVLEKLSEATLDKAAKDAEDLILQ